jgi:hypothetical protein
MSAKLMVLDWDPWIRHAVAVPEMACRRQPGLDDATHQRSVMAAVFRATCDLRRGDDWYIEVAARLRCGFEALMGWRWVEEEDGR